MENREQVREFLASKGINKNRIWKIYLDKNKNSVRFKIWISGNITQQLADSIGRGLEGLGFFKISISLNEIIFSVPD